MGNDLRWKAAAFEMARQRINHTEKYHLKHQPRFKATLPFEQTVVPDKANGVAHFVEAAAGV